MNDYDAVLAALRHCGHVELADRLAAEIERPTEHWSDCAVHNEPALPAGPCDCGGFRNPGRYVAYFGQDFWQSEVHWLAAGMSEPAAPALVHCPNCKSLTFSTSANCWQCGQTTAGSVPNPYGSIDTKPERLPEDVRRGALVGRALDAMRRAGE